MSHHQEEGNRKEQRQQQHKVARSSAQERHGLRQIMGKHSTAKQTNFQYRDAGWQQVTLHLSGTSSHTQ
jgi:hypothetical protein